VHAEVTLLCHVLKDGESADVPPSYSAAVTSSELSIEDLLSLSVAEVNCRLELLSPSERFRLKKLRRTLKSRRYTATYQKRHPERRRRRKYALRHTSDAPAAEVQVCAAFCGTCVIFYA